MKDYNYYNSFIRIAPDCTSEKARVPHAKAGKKTIPVIEYELLAKQPYTLTQEDVLFQTHLQHRFGEEAMDEQEIIALREEFFSKPKACLRCSSLAKTYGWGFHFDEKGRIALIGVDSAAYNTFTQNESLTQYSAMRSKR